MKRALLVLLLAASVPGQAARPYAEWRHSGVVHILTTPHGADLPASASVDDFPILVRLHGDFFAFEQAEKDGADIRFATSDGKPLAYEIDEWDAAGRNASVWVRIPRIRGNTTQAIRMFWGGARSEPGDGGEVFGLDAGFAGVWHLGDDLEDSTANDLHGTNHGAAPAPAIIGRGRRFGAKTFVDCGAKVDCLPSGDADRSMSAWIRPTSYESGPTIGGWGRQGRQHLSYMTLSSRGTVKFHGYAADPEGVTAVPLSEWHHALLTITGGTIRFYFDGALEHATKIRKLDTLSPSGCYIGKHTPPGGRWARHFFGELDEVRFASVARSAEWAKLCYENQRPMQRLVGPLVSQPGGSQSGGLPPEGSASKAGEGPTVRPAFLTLKEGGRRKITAAAGRAIKIYWVLRKHGEERTVAVDRLSYEMEAGRTVMDDRAILEMRAVYADGLKIREVPVRIEEALPDPEFNLPATAPWDGRDRLEIRPEITNLESLIAKGVGRLRYRWEVAGPAVMKRTESGRLVLERALGSGVLTVKLGLRNGGHEVVRSTRIKVREPADDPFVARMPGRDEKPQDHQFFARGRDGAGTLHYRGTLADGADAVYLRVFSGDTLYEEQKQELGADRSYAFEVKLKPGLIKYRVVFGKRDGDRRVELHKAEDLVCGDAYIIQGQSNAEAFDMGRADHPFESDWIRSFGTPRSDEKRARMKLWGNAAGFERADWKLQIGYWGMELAKRLVERHEIPVFIINGAKGGTRIDQHQRDESDPTDVETIYGRLLWRLRQARLTHGVRGVFWHQGENDQGSAGPGGVWGWQTYEDYFVELAASWKRDYPNIEHMYVFQIIPKACAMGTGGSDDMLREMQRRLPERFSNLHVLSTVGVRPLGGCHYPPEGYAKIAGLLLPLVDRDFYDVAPKRSITPPNLLMAAWADAARTAIALTFDQPVTWSSALLPRFHLDGVADLVKSGRVSAAQLTLVLKNPSTADRITYLIGGRWNRKDPVLRGANGIAALTFCDVPIVLPALPPRARNRRGDDLLMAGRFEEAIADFDAYIAAEPRAEPYHWQRGIAYYYAGRYEEGVRQFELHRKVNPNDVENAVWHFLCKAKLDGVAAARRAILPVGPDSRPPMQEVYELFAGRATTADVEREARSAIGPLKEPALFYGHLYIGLFHEAVGNLPAARHHIRVSAKTHTVDGYMGDVARMHASRWR